MINITAASFNPAQNLHRKTIYAICHFVAEKTYLFLCHNEICNSLFAAIRTRLPEIIYLRLARSIVFI
jgi:hypothetical protein